MHLVYGHFWLWSSLFQIGDATLGCYNVGMQLLASQLIGHHIASLQTGGIIGHLHGFVVSPDNLELVGLEVLASAPDVESGIVLLRDIREFGEVVLLDSADEICDIHDIVRLRPIAESGFRLERLPVVTESGQPLGVIEDYSLSENNLQIQKIYVKRPLLLSLFSSMLTIDRSQIVDVNVKKLIVSDATIESRSRLKNLTPAPKPAE